MNQKRIIKIIIMFTTLFLTSPFILNFQGNLDLENDVTEPIVPHKSSTFNYTIAINEAPGNPQNWTWAKDQGICTGSGTENDPYVIKDHFFDTRTIAYNSLEIQH